MATQLERKAEDGTSSPCVWIELSTGDRRLISRRAAALLVSWHKARPVDLLRVRDFDALEDDAQRSRA